MERIILHLDMDAFFASVEQAADPRLAGKPLIVGSRGKKYNTVVAACSYEAKAFGISSGMSTAAALRLCPRALFVPADSAKYLHASDKITQMLCSYAERMERPSIDEFYLDLTKKGMREAVDIAREIKRNIKRDLGVTGSIGIAPAKIVSKIAAKAKKPDGLMTLRQEEVAAFLRELPVEKVPGIGPHMKEYLNEMSVFACGQLSQMDVELLVGRFGKLGYWLNQVSQGIDDAEVGYWDDPEEPPKSVSHSYTLEREISSKEAIRAWIMMLSEMVAYRLRQECLGARTVHLYISSQTGSFSRQKNFSQASSCPKQIYKRAVTILESLGGKRMFCRALGVCASSLGPADGICLFEEDKKEQRLINAMDKINSCFGDWTIYPAAIKQIR